jgi:N-acyl-D-aspartate/D-glutamate deacylase
VISTINRFWYVRHSVVRFDTELHPIDDGIQIESRCVKKGRSDMCTMSPLLGWKCVALESGKKRVVVQRFTDRMNRLTRQNPLLKSSHPQARTSAAFLLLLLCAFTSIHAAEPIDADLLLANGTLHLGDGQPPSLGDVAIRDDKIVAVGEFAIGKVKQTIDCTGLIVSPGFIDLHNHSDEPVTRKETRAVVNFLTQGCTTIVTGNCGSGPVNARSYYDKIDEFGVGVNVAHLLPQGSLRREVIGNEQRRATDDELTRMKELADKAMQDGAWGMSSGLIYVPSSYADTAELTEIAKVVASHHGIYASHIRGEGTDLLDAIGEALEIGRGAKLPVHISHFKSSGKDSWGLVRTAVDAIERARTAGQVVTADQYPYTASSTSLSATFIPAWVRSGGSKQMLARIEAGEDSQRAQAAIRKKLEVTDAGQRIQIANYAPRPEWAGRRLKEIADEEQIEPFDLILQIEKNGGAQVVNHSISEEDVRFVMQLPWVATASDGSSRIPNEEVPHPRSYGTFSRKIGHYSVREQAVPLPQAIRSSSGLPADILGLKDRGYLRPGYFADVIVWSENELIDRATFDSPHQYSDGIRYAFVNGTPVISDGDVTGALPGRALRHKSLEK